MDLRRTKIFNRQTVILPCFFTVQPLMVVFKPCTGGLLSMCSFFTPPNWSLSFETQQVQTLFNCWNSNRSLCFQSQATDSGLHVWAGVFPWQCTLYSSTPPNWGFANETQQVQTPKWQLANLLALYRSWIRE